MRSGKRVICVLALFLGGGLGWGAVRADPSPRPRDDGHVVSRADDGGTLSLRSGERFVVDLGLGYGWTVDVSDPRVLERVHDVMVIRGAQGLYEALRPGETTVTAAGVPDCVTAVTPCAPRSVSFQLHVRVRGPMPDPPAAAE